MSTILAQTTIGAAVANQLSQVFDLKANGQKLPLSISAQAVFNYGAGGTTAKFWLQTSLDGGTTWMDVISFAFTTAAATKFGAVNRQVAVVPVAPTDATLADNTKNDGFVGTLWRVKYTTTGTYTGATNIKIDVLGEN